MSNSTQNLNVTGKSQLKLKEGSFSRTSQLQESSAKLQEYDLGDDEESKGSFSQRVDENDSSAYDSSQVMGKESPGGAVYVSI